MTKFKFFIGGYFGTSFRAELKMEDLHFFISDYSLGLMHLQPTHIISTKDNPDWQKFVLFLESLDWDTNYHNNDIMDGTQWEIFFRNKNFKLKSFGSNEYPKQFKKLIRLLNAITRRHTVPFEVY